MSIFDPLEASIFFFAFTCGNSYWSCPKIVNEPETQIRVGVILVSGDLTSDGHIESGVQQLHIVYGLSFLIF